MIYTGTMTPSIDYTTYLDTFIPGNLNRTKEVYYYPGGKGINVSRVLHRLGTDTKALGFIGGFTGSYLEQFLQEEHIASDFIQTNDVTRINVKIKADTETELNGPGPNISAENQQQLLDKVKTFIQGDWFVLAGSLPVLTDGDFYKKLADECRRKGVHFVLDTSGPALKQLIDARPFLIKPNQDELGELFNTTIKKPSDGIEYAKQLVNRGVQHVIVSLGGDGALLVTGEETLVARAPEGKVVNTVGAGDSLVAGFIAAYTQGESTIDAFRYAVATGSATAFQTDLCHRQDVESLLPYIQIEKINE